MVYLPNFQVLCFMIIMILVDHVALCGETNLYTFVEYAHMPYRFSSTTIHFSFMFTLTGLYACSAEENTFIKFKRSRLSANVLNRINLTVGLCDV